MDNPMIGQHGGQPPTVCAVSGQELRRPWVTIALAGSFYCRVLAKFQHQFNDETRAKLEAALPRGAPERKVKVTDGNSN
jgi:hypothetical protein